MRKYVLGLLMVLAGAGVWLLSGPKEVHSIAVGPQLVITQLKVSSTGQFISLYNNTAGDIDLGMVQLQYFNNYDLANATTSKLIKLSGEIPAHGYAVVSDGAFQACYQMAVNAVSLDMSTTAGLVQVSHFLGSGSPRVASLLDDYVGWSKKAAAGAQTLPGAVDGFLQRQAGDGSANYAKILIPGDGKWVAAQPAANGCVGGGIAPGGGQLTKAAAAIPYSIIAAAALSSIPADDAGLAAPQISEVLPNPASPRTDANDEFIELYNSNAKPFDLSGFILQVGTTTVHRYTFPDGTSIEPRQFSAFYSSDTNLNLSNSDGQVRLLDPGGNQLEQTDEYTGAKDDYAWVKADGLWQWTHQPTPGAANVIIASAPKSSKNQTSSSKPLVKGAVAASSSGTSGTPPAAPSAVALHPLVLAGVGAAALLYGLYEYHHDLANFVYKLQRHRAARRTAG